MAGQDLVRPSRDGDQFHYVWAARRCLQLLPGAGDLVAVTIEGASKNEAADSMEAGEELIDVGLYFGSEKVDQARLINYVQLKHSTRDALKPWTASGLKKTLKGFAKRYSELIKCFSPQDVAQRFRFEFTTNRPIVKDVVDALSDLASGVYAQSSDLHDLIINYTGLDRAKVSDFFTLFSVEAGEEGLWRQRNLLTQDVKTYLPDADYDAPIQLKDLVTRKATTEFESNPSIRCDDVLHALKTDEAQLRPAECCIPDASNTLPREQEQKILKAVLSAQRPVVIHADGGVGKSVLSARLASLMPIGSESILYDCFGDGLYRNSLHFRHRHSDALVQIANELSARGLCHPLIPTVHADSKMYMRSFLGRINQAVGVLRAKNPEANLCLIIDAADNAEMAAEEQREPNSFVRDLIRVSLPDGVRLVFTCRTHRQDLLKAPLDAQEVELLSFSESESARHLRSFYPLVSNADIAEFAFLSSANPRLQALALSRKLPFREMMKQLGPEPTTVDSAIGDILGAAVAKLRDKAGAVEASQIDLICQGLAVLRPLIPITVLAQLSQTSESAVRSFALDLGRPLLVKGNSIHFLDEPAETWFRDKFLPDTKGLASFLEHLRPLTDLSSYAASVLPQLLLQAGKLDELVELALSGDGLPTGNPLEKRDVELQRLTFALKACLQQKSHMAAVKLALKAGGESAGEQRQNGLIQENTEISAILMSQDRLEEIVSRRTFSDTWMGSHHAYNAGLLSGCGEFSAEASSSLRMARGWQRTLSRLPEDERENGNLSIADLSELAMAMLRLRSPKEAAQFLRGFSPRSAALETGRHLAKRLIDIGEYDLLDALTDAAGNDVWLLLGIAAEARVVAYSLESKPLERLLRLLADRRVKLELPQRWDEKWTLLDAVRSAIEVALPVLPQRDLVYAEILQRYVPATPPSDLVNRFGAPRISILRAYTLEATLRGHAITLLDIAPPDIRKELDAGNSYGHSQDADVYSREIGGLLPWFILSSATICGRAPSDLSDAIEAAIKAVTSSESRDYRDGNGLFQIAAIEWFKILRDSGKAQGEELEAFKSWVLNQKKQLWPNTLITICREASRANGFEALAMHFASEAYQGLESTREDAESKVDFYLKLTRAVISLSPEEARAYFDRAVEIASRIGEENLDRWAALLHLSTAAGERNNPRPETAHRLSRVAELTYEYVARDKHFDWESTADALTGLCASSAMAILSRWRDRRFGDAGRLLPNVLYRLVDMELLPAVTPVAFGGMEANWSRLKDLKRAVAEEADFDRSHVLARVAYRYMRVQPSNEKEWLELRELGKSNDLSFPEINRITAVSERRESAAKKNKPESTCFTTNQVNQCPPDWDAIFKGVDLTDTCALHSAYMDMRSYDTPYQTKAFYHEAFNRVRVGRESELMSAIAAMPSFGIFTLQDLVDALPSPLPVQVAFRKAIREAVLIACRREPNFVRRSGWGACIPLNIFDKEGIVPDRDVVDATLEGFMARVGSLNAGELFQLVDSLAACVTPDEASEALNFGFDLLEEVISPEDGDGPWRPELQPPQLLTSSLAGYVWAGLGSSVASVRWQNAHVVRSLVELGWTEFLEELVNWAQTDVAFPFVDQGLEFYIWHARQWLLIGLARGGLENASALRPSIELLQQWLREEHVLIRALAAQSLQTLVAKGELKAEEIGDLNSVNRPLLPERVCSGWSEPMEDEVQDSEEPLNNDEKYYFGIDIGPYWFNGLGHAFGLTWGAIERRALHAIRNYMGGGRGKRLEDARYTRKIFDDRETNHSHGSLPKTDDLCAYHGYHSMMFVAAKLLKECAVRRDTDEPTHAFQIWLSEYLLTCIDGMWLADMRDPRLVMDAPPSEGYNDKLWRWSVSADYLDQNLVTDDGLIAFWGNWTGGETEYNETVSIRSALVSRVGAEALVAALQTAPDLNRFSLPCDGAGDEIKAGHLKLRGWVVDEYVSKGVDEADPWAEGLHYRGPEPSKGLITKLGLIETTDGRSWVVGSNTLLRSEAWTYSYGYGRDTETTAGNRLSGSKEFIKNLLNAHPEFCLILNVEVQRRSLRYGSDKDEFEPYPWPYNRYYIMEKDGVAHAL